MIQRSGTQLKHGSHCGRDSRWYSSNLDCHCVVLLFPTSTSFASAVRPAHRIGQAGAYNPQVSSRPVLGQETALSSLPASTSLMRPYVRPLPLPPVALMCFLTDRMRATHLLSPGTKQFRTCLTTLLKHFPYRTPEIYTPLPPRPAQPRSAGIKGLTTF